MKSLARRGDVLERLRSNRETSPPVSLACRLSAPESHSVSADADSTRIHVGLLSLLGVEISGGQNCIATWTAWQVNETSINVFALAAATIVSIMR